MWSTLPSLPPEPEIYPMKTISVDIDNTTWSKAEQKAEALATSLDRVVTDYLRSWAGDQSAVELSRRAMRMRFAQPACKFAVGTPDSREQRNARR